MSVFDNIILATDSYKVLLSSLAALACAFEAVLDWPPLVPHL